MFLINGSCWSFSHKCQYNVIIYSLPIAWLLFKLTNLKVTKLIYNDSCSTPYHALRPRQMANIWQIFFKLAFFNANVDILIPMCFPSYLLFFCLVVNININQQGSTSNPVPHTWSKSQHKNFTGCKFYQRKKIYKQLKELNRLLILPNFVDKRRKL